MESFLILLGVLAPGFALALLPHARGVVVRLRHRANQSTVRRLEPR